MKPHSTRQKVFSVVAKCVAVMWLGRASLFFVAGGYRPYLTGMDQLLERAFWAMLDGFLALPQTITWILSGVMWLAAQVIPPLQETFGFDMSEISAEPALEWSGPHLGADRIAFGQVLDVALIVVAVAISIQFLTLFGILALNKAVVWMAPARPSLEGRKSLLYGAVPLSAGLLATAMFFPSNPVGAVLGGMLVGLVVRFPYLGALPIWLGFLVGLRPHHLLDFLGGVLTSLRSWQTDRNNDEGQQRSRTHSGEQKSEQSGRGNSRHQRERSSSAEAPKTGKAAYQDALSLLGLIDGDFDRTALRRRFTELATRLHADHGGSDGLMRSLNHAYDVALAHNGWRR